MIGYDLHNPEITSKSPDSIQNLSQNLTHLVFLKKDEVTKLFYTSSLITLLPFLNFLAPSLIFTVHKVSG